MPRLLERSDVRILHFYIFLLLDLLLSIIYVVIITVMKVVTVGLILAPTALGFLTRVAITCRWTSTLSSLYQYNATIHLFHDWFLGLCLMLLWMAKFQRLPPLVVVVIGYLRGYGGVAIGNGIVRTLHFIERREWTTAYAALSRLNLMGMKYFQPILVQIVALTWYHLKAILELWLVINKAGVGEAASSPLSWLIHSADEWLVINHLIIVDPYN